MTQRSRLHVAVALVALTGCATAAPHDVTASPNLALATDLGPARSISPAASEGHEAIPQPMPKLEVASAGSAAAEMKMPGMAAAPVQQAHDGHNDAHGTGTVNSINAAQHTLNISHNPIPAIGWPAMTMDFHAAPNVDLKALKPGAKVNFTIEQGKDGMYEVQAISPAGTSK